MTKQADSLSDTDVLAEAKQENSLIANIVRDERDAAAKAEDKFFAGKTEEKGTKAGNRRNASVLLKR